METSNSYEEIRAKHVARIKTHETEHIEGAWVIVKQYRWINGARVHVGTYRKPRG